MLVKHVLLSSADRIVVGAVLLYANMREEEPTTQDTR